MKRRRDNADEEPDGNDSDSHVDSPADFMDFSSIDSFLSSSVGSPLEFWDTNEDSDRSDHDSVSTQFSIYHHDTSTHRMIEGHWAPSHDLYIGRPGYRISNEMKNNQNVVTAAVTVEGRALDFASDDNNNNKYLE